MHRIIFIICVLIISQSCSRQETITDTDCSNGKKKCLNKPKEDDFTFQYEFRESENRIIRLHPELQSRLWKGSIALSADNYNIKIYFSEMEQQNIPILELYDEINRTVEKLKINEFEKKFEKEIAFVNYALRKNFSEYQNLGNFTNYDVMRFYKAQLLFEARIKSSKTSFFQNWKLPLLQDNAPRFLSNDF